MRWTEEQYKAIKSRNKNILVSAAAGSGKTAVLVERIIDLITSDNNIDLNRILVVTFTNAAATEMKERIGKELAKRISINNSDKLQEQYLLLSKANIMTIHSFCYNVIKENFNYIDIDPSFRIGEQTEILLIKQEAVEKLMEVKFSENDKQFLEFAQAFSGDRDDVQLTETIIKTYDFIQSSPWPVKWLEQNISYLSDSYSMGFEETLWGTILIDFLKNELYNILNQLKRAKLEAENRGLIPYAEILQDDCILIEDINIKKNDKWDTIVNKIDKVKFKKLKPIRNVADEDKDIVKDIRNTAKRRFEDLKKNYFNKISQEIFNNIKYITPYMECLSRVVKDFKNIYEDIKTSRNIIDFNDLEHYCIKILLDDNDNPTDAALSYRNRFDEILVDEYQDSNMVQEVILDTICGKDIKGPHRFMVGDVKQSIYRFRQAQPEIFMGKYRAYPINNKGLNNKILLNKNFRSSKGVIDCINYIFSQIMTLKTAEVDYTEKEMLIPGLKNINQDNVESEVNLIDLKTKDSHDSIDDEFDKKIEEINNTRCEAKAVADNIYKLVYEEGYDYRNICILLRSLTGYVDEYVDEFTSRGIPVYADVQEGFFKTTEVNLIISILNVIDNPYQDIPLLSVMRAPFFSFSTDDLVLVRNYDKLSFYNAVKSCSLDQTELGLKCKTFLEKVEKWRQKAIEYQVDELIYYLYTSTGYMEYLTVLPYGQQRIANLRMLFEKAKAFEKTSFKGLFNFLMYIDNLKNSNYDMGSATLLGEKDNVVRIMSVHKSKGLEFPIVIFCGLGKKFNFQDTSKKILMHKDLGFGPDLIDLELRITYPTILKKTLAMRIKSETIAEEMRILYVALTRAKNKLILYGCLKDMEKSLNSWADVLQYNSEKIPEDYVLRSNRYIDWIGMALIRHSMCRILRESTINSKLENINIIEDKSNWDINILRKEDIVKANLDCEKKERYIDLIKKISSDNYSGEIDKKLSWVYPYKDAISLPTKVSVTELKRLFDISEEGSHNLYPQKKLKRPSFIVEKSGLSSSEKGTALHLFMQHLDFLNTTSINNIKKQKEKLINKGIMSNEQAESIDNTKILNFIKSPIGLRIKKADELYRETPFTVILNSSEIFNGVNSQEDILLQGVIDCYFKEGNNSVMIDYKTDNVNSSSISKIKERYKMQIEYYSKAIEIITGKKVDEKYIYLFSCEEIIEM